MNIAMTGLSPNVGGVETFVISIYKLLKSDNVHFYFLTSSKEKLYYEDEIIKNGDFIIRYSPRTENFIKFKNELKNIFRNYHFDVFWDNVCSLSMIDDIIASYDFHVPIRIIHSHNSKNMSGLFTNLMHNLNKKRISKYATHYFACSSLAGKWMFPIQKWEKIVFIKNGVDRTKFRYDVESRKKIRTQLKIDNKLVFGHVGRFHEQKNHLFLIDIFKEIHKIHNDSVLILCGSGDLENSIKKKVKDNDLLSSVFFLGNQSNINEYMSAFDLLLFPSKYEGLPFVLIEAQANNLPCLISCNISQEVAITELVHFLSLNDSSKIWAETALNLSTKKRIDYSNQFKKSGYDLNDNYSLLNKILGMEE